MDINSVYPSTSGYLRAADLKGRDSVVTVQRFTLEDLGDKAEKPVIGFQESEKRLVLNRTNAAQMQQLFGAETEGWIGKRLTLYPTTVNYQGDMVACIRLRGAEQFAAPPAAPPGGAAPRLTDADIPF